MKDLRFPAGFYWGASTASYQVEGGIEHNDWAQAARDGRVPTCGRACDHYNRYEYDFDIAQKLGHNAHRFSIEWARIEPEEGKWNTREVEHYRAVLRALRARNLEPFVTLWHFTLPDWFAAKGGFANPDAPKLFARYCAFVVRELGDLATHFSTMNEPSVVASNGYLRGSWPPFKRFKLTDMISITNSGKSYNPNPEKGVRPLLTYIKVRKHLIAAHNQAYTAIKTQVLDCDVSIVKHVIVFRGIGFNPLNRLKAWFANYQWTYYFMNRVIDHCDSIGLNYYLYVPFGDRREWKKTDMNWNFAPEYIHDALLMLKRYNKPVFVSEAGLADADDSDRADYIKKQVEATWQAMQEGVDVRGHMYWSLLDNYEWALGFEKRFGLVEIDYRTFERKPRPSAYVYKDIIENNGILE